MKSKSRLYNTIIKILSQHKKWLDVRPMFTLAWMIVGLIWSGIMLNDSEELLLIYL